jgi:hypothetical protein
VVWRPRGFAHSPDEEIAEIGFVFDDQNAHDALSTATCDLILACELYSGSALIVTPNKGLRIILTLWDKVKTTVRTR